MPTLKKSAPQKIKVLQADSADLKEKAFSIRKEVFVGEQKVSPSDEFDQYEDIARHFVALDKDEPVGAARWRTTEKGVKLERFAVKKSYRGQQIGSRLVELVMEDVKDQLGKGQHIYLNAQLPAIPLYLKYGFKKVGEQFEECNILHFEMFLDS